MLRLCLSLYMLACVSLAHAEIYKYVDENGQVYFSDVPIEKSVVTKLGPTNIATRKDAKNKTWSEWKTYSEPMQISFGEIGLYESINLIAEHAMKTDKIVIENNLLATKSIKIQYHWVPWAQIVEQLVKEHNLYLEYKDNVVMLYENPGQKP